MKSIAVKTSIILLALVALMQAGIASAAREGSLPAQATGVTFYQDANYGGVASGVKAPGDYAVMPADVPNDWMSSLRVPAGWTVQAYADGNLTGAVCTFTVDTSFVGAACNDVMSSFRITGPAGPTSTPSRTATRTNTPPGPTATATRTPTVTPTQPSSGANLALNKPATGSTACNANEGPAKAVNGTSTGGNTDKFCSTTAPLFLQVDLGAAFNVSSFVVKHAGAGGESATFNTRDFTIQASTDNVTWTTVVTVIANTASTSTHAITTRSARYVRLNITAPEQGGTGAARIYEFEVYGASGPTLTATATLTPTRTPTCACLTSTSTRTATVTNTPVGPTATRTRTATPTRTSTSGPSPTRTHTPTATPTQPPAGTNLALNKPASGSTACVAAEGPAQAVNGSVTAGGTDKFCSAAPPLFLQVDLGATYNVASFVVKHAGAGGEDPAWNTRDFNIQTSTDNATWTPVVTVTGNASSLTTHAITTRSARYVRLNITVPTQTTDATARIYEFEVYGPGVGPTVTPTTPPAASQIFRGYYKIVARHSGKVLNIEGASIADDARAVQWPYDPAAGTNDEWQLVEVAPGAFRITARHSGKALAVLGAGTADGTQVVQRPHDTNAPASDEWTIADAGGGFVRITNPNSGKVLEVAAAGTADGALVQQRTWSGATNQQWQLVPVWSGYHRIVARHSGKVLNVSGASTADGGDVIQWPYAVDAQYNDEWEILELGTGYYRITARHSAKVLQVAGAGTGSGANVDQSTWASGNHQQWTITDAGGGYYRLTARHSGMVLNVAGASTADNANVDQATWSGATNQQWQIVPVSQGPGLSKVTFTAAEVFTPISRIQATLADGTTRRGLGLVTMHNGWLATVPGTDSGNAGGSFSFYDISNPRAPQRVAQRDVSSLREQHGFARSAPGAYGGDYVVLQSGSGIEFWDWTDVRNPALLNAMSLPGVAFSDYDVGSWWLAWQAPFVYVAASGNGIFIVDASNPRSPTLVRQIPTSQTGGFRIHSIFAIGNLLVAASADFNGTSTGVVTMDISDPRNPTVIRSEKDGLPIVYSMFFNGNKLIGAGFNDHQVHVWDLSNPAAFPKLGAVGGMDKPAYATFLDGFALVGDETSFVKVNINNFTIAGEGTSGESDRSEDIAAPLGNVVLMSNDHQAPSAIIPHTAAPDNTGPSVNMVNPANNAANQRVSSRVGITLTDWPELRSVDNTTFIVRPLGGVALTGKYSGEQGILNFWPNQPLLPGTTYEVVIPAGGIKDLSGNGVPSTFTSRFTTAGASATPPTVQTRVNAPVAVGTAVNFAITASSGGALTYSWDFGDGSAPTAFSAASTASHAYAAPGHYSAMVTARNASGQATSSYIQVVHHPLPAGRPNQSGTLALDSARSRMWVVNPDADTVTAINTTNDTKVLEQAVGTNPRSVARAPDGTIWVVNQGSASISVLNGDTGAVVQTISLPYASQPFGIAFAPSGAAAYVTTEGSRQLLRLDPASRAINATLNLGFPARGVAVSHDSARILVTRFVSPANRGEVVEVSGSTFALVRTFALAFDTTSADGSTSGRGVPNYISALAISPDGRQARVPSKKDNTARGQFRDGQPLTFETTVRGIVSYLDLVSNSENFALRTDFNDRDMASAAVYSARGDYVFVATQGTNTVEVLDAYDNRLLTGIPNTGLAPQGLALSADGRKLYVQNFMSRSVSVYDVSGIVDSSTNTYTKVADILTVAVEKLAPTVLRGKQIFYNAADRRMNLDGYITCADCHLDGGEDGRIWDFTNRGEGLRNTITLRGRRGTGQGNVHWTGNFNEIQDFEHDIRSAFGGTGFLTDAQFNTGTRNTPLGDPKGGLSSDLDALAAFVTSLNRAPASPYRNADGTLTAGAAAGRTIFQQLGCGSCHGGPDFTDSAGGVLHNVGTLKPSSGLRLGQPLTGLDTPTLKGLWQTGPYLHDGSAATLLDVLTTANPSGQHGNTAGLTAAQRQQLVDFLLQIDESEPAP